MKRIKTLAGAVGIVLLSAVPAMAEDSSSVGSRDLMWITWIGSVMAGKAFTTLCGLNPSAEAKTGIPATRRSKGNSPLFMRGKRNRRPSSCITPKGEPNSPTTQSPIPASPRLFTCPSPQSPPSGAAFLPSCGA